MPSTLQEHSLPVISLERLRNPETSPEEISRLLQVCETSGFFFLSDHGVPLSLIHRVWDASRAFFLLPKAVKEEYGQDKHDVKPSFCRGYSATEILNPVQGYDRKEIYDMGIERPNNGEPFTGPNIVLPDSVAPDFAKSHGELQKVVVETIVPVLGRAFARALGEKDTLFHEALDEMTLIHRCIYYPETGGMAGKHTDNGLFTVLIQEALDTRPLQVYTGGKWVEVEAREDMFVINLGDILQKWTDGRFVSTPHQVQHKPGTTRLTAPFFVYPDIKREFKSFAGHKIITKKIMLRNYESIWETKGGAGRARELE